MQTVTLSKRRLLGDDPLLGVIPTPPPPPPAQDLAAVAVGVSALGVRFTGELITEYIDGLEGANLGNSLI